MDATSYPSTCWVNKCWTQTYSWRVKETFVMDLWDNGISSSYVKFVIDVCGGQLIQKVTPMNMLGTILRNFDTLSPVEVNEVEACKGTWYSSCDSNQACNFHVPYNRIKACDKLWLSSRRWPRKRWKKHSKVHAIKALLIHISCECDQNGVMHGIVKNYVCNHHVMHVSWSHLMSINSL